MHRSRSSSGIGTVSSSMRRSFIRIRLFVRSIMQANRKSCNVQGSQRGLGIRLEASFGVSSPTCNVHMQKLIERQIGLKDASSKSSIFRLFLFAILEPRSNGYREFCQYSASIRSFATTLEFEPGCKVRDKVP